MVCFYPHTVAARMAREARSELIPPPRSLAGSDSCLTLLCFRCHRPEQGETYLGILARDSRDVQFFIPSTFSHPTIIIHLRTWQTFQLVPHRCFVCLTDLGPDSARHRHTNGGSGYRDLLGPADGRCRIRDICRGGSRVMKREQGRGLAELKQGCLEGCAVG